MKYKIIFFSTMMLLGACATTQDHVNSLHSTSERELTAGIVQREIRKGMSQGDVAMQIGSPNIVSKDSSGQETWIYDRVATEASYSHSQSTAGGLGGLAADVGSVLLLGLANGSYNTQSGASAVTQKTLTVVIKYDQNGRVDSATYHSVRF
jgi:outer membrane protein assembly factor BamE (lipoprotein component of BamABCDE complex)